MLTSARFTGVWLSGISWPPPALRIRIVQGISNDTPPSDDYEFCCDMHHIRFPGYWTHWSRQQQSSWCDAPALLVLPYCSSCILRTRDAFWYNGLLFFSSCVRISCEPCSDVHVLRNPYWQPSCALHSSCFPQPLAYCTLDRNSQAVVL